MKVCSKCNVEKPYSEFPKDKTHISGYHSNCKECKYKNRNPNQHTYDFQRYHSKVLLYWIVYLLPNANNYVGHTNNPTNRMYHHKYGNKRDITGWVELARFNNKQEALLFEKQKREQYRHTAPFCKHE